MLEKAEAMSYEHLEQAEAKSAAKDEASHGRASTGIGKSTANVSSGGARPPEFGASRKNVVGWARK